MSATSSSAGVSLQTPEDVMINSDFGGDSATASSKVDEENKGKCFYTLCEKSTLCKVIPFGYFKDRKHAMYCYLFSAMMACLLIAVIAPIVSPHIH